jgi:hypothetical protein
MHAGQPTEFRFEFDRSTDRIQGGAALKSKWERNGCIARVYIRGRIRLAVGQKQFGNPAVAEPADPT